MVMRDIEDRTRRAEISGIKTLFDLLTFMLAGWQPELYILAARPSMGKTSYGLQEAVNASMSGHKVAFFSLEMSRRRLIEKLLSNIGMVRAQNFRHGRFDSYEWSRMQEAAAKLLEAYLYIDDSSGLSPSAIAQRCRKQKAKHGLDMVVIDYLQLVKHEKADSMNYAVGASARMFKELSKELDIPVICLAQLSRGLEGRNEKRPQLSDLRDSGEIEQHADNVLFLYRDEYYNPATDKKGVAEIRVAKQRNGPLGVVEVLWLPDFTRFSPKDGEQQPVQVDKPSTDTPPATMAEVESLFGGGDDGIPF